MYPLVPGIRSSGHIYGPLFSLSYKINRIKKKHHMASSVNEKHIHTNKQNTIQHPFIVRMAEKNPLDLKGN